MELTKLKKSYYLWAGILLIALSLVICLGLGYVGRTFSFIPNYLFGFGTFFFVIILALLGLRLVLREKFKKIKIRYYVSFGIFALGLCLLLTSVITYNQTGNLLTLSNINEYFNPLFSSFYSDIKSFFLFNNNGLIGGGIIGYFLTALLNQLFNNVAGSIIISSLLIFSSLVIVLLPIVLKLIKNKKANELSKEEDEVLSIETKSDEEPLIEDKNESFKTDSPVFEIKDSTKQVIKEASSLPNDSPSISVPMFESESTPVVEEIHDTNGLFDALYEDPNAEPKEEIKPYFETPKEEIKPSFESTTSVSTEPISEPVSSDAILEEPTFIEQSQKEIEIPSSEVITPNVTPSVVVEEHYSAPSVDSVSKPTTTPPPLIHTVKDYNDWVTPPSDLLIDLSVDDVIEKNTERAERWKAIIDLTLQNFKINAHVISYNIGPAVTRFNIEPDPGVSVSVIEKRVDDLNRVLGGKVGRFESIVQGEIFSGYEVPNDFITSVSFKDCFINLEETNAHPLQVVVGKNLVGNVETRRLDKFPHLLVAGTTMSGKSVFVKSLLLTLIMRNRPDQLRIALVDPKFVEFGFFEDIPHLLCPIVDDPNKVPVLLEKMKDEMNNRYKLLKQYHVANIGDYLKAKEKNPSMPKMPYILFCVDEFADLSQTNKEIASLCSNIAAKARACGIHLLIATQKPASEVLPGLLKGNLPTHICFSVNDAVSSVNVIGVGGAETLQGRGDGLYQGNGEKGLLRFQSPFIQDEEITAVIEYIKSKYPTDYDPDFSDLEVHKVNTDTYYVPDPLEEGGSDEKDNRYDEIVECVMQNEYISSSRLTHMFNMGYTRAGKIIYQLQKNGVIDTIANGNKGFKVLKHDSSYIEGQGIVTSSEQSSYDEGFTPVQTYEEPSDDNDGDIN